MHATCFEKSKVLEVFKSEMNAYFVNTQLTVTIQISTTVLNFALFFTLICLVFIFDASS